MSYQPKRLLIPRLGRQIIRRAGPYDCGAQRLVELPGDAEWAQLHAASAADAYVRRLREKKK